MEPLLKGRQWFTAIGLAILFLTALIAVFITRNAGVEEATIAKTHRAPVVDERPLRTAQAVAKLSASWDEQRLANEALRVSDHEVDLAFADALRDASDHPAQHTPQTEALYTRLSKAQEQQKHDQDRIDGLKKQLASASGAKQDAIQQQIDLAQAQLELDEDDVDGAKTELIRSGADKLSRVQRQFKRHEDNEHASDTSHSQNGPAATPINFQSDTLWGQIQAWRALNVKISQLQSAIDEATEVASALTQAHAAEEQKLTTERSTLAGAPENQPASSPATQVAATPVTVSSLKVRSDDQRTLVDLGKRLQDMEQGQTAYGNWVALVRRHQRVALHGIFESLLWILLIVLVVFITDRAIDHYLTRPTGEYTLFRTLRVVIRFSVQAVGVILILFVVLGIPQQMPTILGFAGAGLTVALKDFIVAFFGWFVLMGKNGIRVGDWVEIDGVAGEVIEINLLRTVLLETGNWTTTGHPTGRKVNFVNSYAIEGHFFNFTTSGQWLWDELKYTISADRDPYGVVEAIQKTLNRETEPSTRAAEEEWARETKNYRVRSVSAAPAINVHPTPSGIEVQIRYITRAHERHAMRAQLNQAIVRLLHQGVSGEEATSAARLS